MESAPCRATDQILLAGYVENWEAEKKRRSAVPYDAIHCNEHQDVFLNGAEVDGDERWDVVEQYVAWDFRLVRQCPYCSTGLFFARKAKRIRPNEEWIEEVVVGECPRCAYWHAMWYEDLGQGPFGGPTAEWEARIGKLAEFDDCLPDGCQSELARYLRAHPNKWHDLSPPRLETLVADIFRANYANSEVFHVGKPDDGGVDVVFVDSGRSRWLIQVKRRLAPMKGEGVETIRNLLGAMVLNECRCGIVVSTVDHFTYRAHEARNRAAEIGFKLSFVDLGKLDRMLNSVLPSVEWLALVRDHKPEWVNELGSKIPDRHQLSFWKL
jgi:hypothetical protein